MGPSYQLSLTLRQAHALLVKVHLADHVQGRVNYYDAEYTPATNPEARAWMAMIADYDKRRVTEGLDSALDNMEAWIKDMQPPADDVTIGGAIIEPDGALPAPDWSH